MTTDVAPRISLPASAKKGQVIEIKTLIAHPMESGQRMDPLGTRIPRKILNRFVCTYSGEVVFEAVLRPAISANPFLAFTTIATESGEIVMTWTDDDGTVSSASRRIEVT